MELEEIKQIRLKKKKIASRKLIKLFQTFYPPTPLAGQASGFLIHHPFQKHCQCQTWYSTSHCEDLV